MGIDIISPGAGSVYDSRGDVFTIAANGTVDMNGKPLGYTAGVISGAEINGQFWQENSAGNWWEYTGNPNAPWTGMGGPSPANLTNFNALVIQNADYNGAAGTSAGDINGKNLSVQGGFNVTDATVEISAKTLSGGGAFTLADNGFLSVAGGVSNETFDVGGNGGMLAVRNPYQFGGSINMEFDHDFNWVFFQGLSPSSYSWNGSELMFYNGNNVTSEFKLTDPEFGPPGSGKYPLSVTHGGGGVYIGNPGVGTAVPVHT